jgi:predicted NBD/HSP70 family sugar kinase
MQGKVDGRAMREMNRALLLGLIRRERAISRTDLARRSSLTKPTVSAIIDELLHEGLVRETGFDESLAKRGRRARLLELDGEAAAFVGVLFGVSETTIGVADALGELRTVWRGESFPGEPDKALERLKPMINTALVQAKVPRSRVAATGVAVAGLVDQRSGACLLAPNLGWHGVPVRAAVQEALGVPTVVHNVTQAGAAAEGRLGAARGVRSFVWIYVARGIGAGIVLDGQIFFGSTGYSGEIGHCVVLDQGPLCGCGRRGCLETVASELAIPRAAHAAARGPEPTRLRDLAEPIDVRAVAAAAREGDEPARRIFADVGDYLGIGISYVVNLFAPELVVLAGAVTEAGDCLLDPVRASVARHAIAPDEVPVVTSKVADDFLVRGSILLAMDVASPEDAARPVLP